MNHFKSFLYTLIFVFTFQMASAQTVDSTKNLTNFSGSIGITNNGFSIIPSFSLNSPAVITNLSWRKKRFSFEPDIRFVPNLSKGSMLWWLRYRLVDNNKFSLRVGTHPAFTMVRKKIVENGLTIEITEMFRAIAFEVVPSYQFNKHFGLSAMYLQGNGLQKNTGPQLVRVLFLNTSITNINLSENVVFNLFPSVFFLYADGRRGDYFTTTGVLTHKKLPFSVQSTINKTIKSNLEGNKDFMWNIGVNYIFNRNLKKVD